VIIAPAASGKGVMNNSKLLINKVHEKLLSESLEKIKAVKKRNRDDNSAESSLVNIKILPANISTSEMYTFLENNEDGLIIIESEADTMSNMLKNDWSNYSDVLRKAFHHEPLSLSRKTDSRFTSIEEPKLAILLSGTPEQLLPLIKSKENGLFSRFITYNFDELSEFKNVFAKNKRNNKISFESLGNKVFKLYGMLLEQKSQIEFSLTEKQEEKFLKNMPEIREDIIKNHFLGFVSNVHRHGLILFRLAMVLTIIRNIDNIDKKKKIVCSNLDYCIAFNLMETLLEHSKYTYNSIDHGAMSIQEEELFDKLEPVFSRENLIVEGNKLNIPTRTLDDKISKWKMKKIIKKVDRSRYKKL
jgi:hypothetical protein